MVYMGYVLFCCLLLATGVIILVKGQFPKACVNKNSLKKRECCPVPPGFTKPCGSDAGRGHCEELTVRNWTVEYNYYNTRDKLDDRHDWPRGVFKRSCKCRANYASYDCSKCQYGYHGNQCSQKKVLIRKNFAKMSPDEQDKFMMYINMSRYVDSNYAVTTSFYKEISDTINNGGDPTLFFTNVSIHELFVWLHYYTVDRNIGLPYMDFAHNAQGFPTWHRLYLLTWERNLQEMSGDENYTIPFWDWTESDKCEICSYDLLGNTSANGDVEGKYFEDWNTTCSPSPGNVANNAKLCDPKVNTGKLKRLPGKPNFRAGNGLNLGLPTKEEVAFALRFETYDLGPFSQATSCSFRNLVEGYVNTTTGYPLPPLTAALHNIVHLAMGGTIGVVPASSNDPIFALHHCFVDRILEKWLRKYKKNASVLTATEAPIGHNRGDVIVPIFPVYRHEDLFAESFSFGYDYEEIDEEGKSPDDEEVGDSSLGRCPVRSVSAADTKPADSGDNCIEWKIAAWILSAGILLCLIVLIVTVTVYHKKSKNRVRSI